MYGYDSYGFPAYVSVAEKKERSAKMLARLTKKNKSLTLKPIILQGRTIAKTFWGKAWCDNIESYQDFENRLERGRSYVRCNAILDLQITEGHVSALVAGSDRDPYQIQIAIKPLSQEKWENLKKKCLGKISSLLSLIQGKLPPEILKEFCSIETGLFPSPDEMTMKCSCPDYASLCKHLAAVLYGIGARLDENPRLFFTLRKINGNELIGLEAATISEGVESEIAEENLESIFGVAFDEVPENEVQKSEKINAAGKKKDMKNESVSPLSERAEINTTSAIQESKSGTFEAPSNSIMKKERAEQGTQDKKEAISPKKKNTKWTGKKLAVFRKKHGLFKTKLAELLGLSTQTVTNWEKGITEIKPKYFDKLNLLSEQMSSH